VKKRRRKKSLKSDVGDFVGAGVGLGVGTAIVAKTGHGSKVLPAFGTAGRMMKPVGIGMMGGHALRLLKKKYKPKRRR